MYCEKSNIPNGEGKSCIATAFNSFLFVICAILMMLFCGTIEVRAGTLDSNGYTVAEDLSGTSYALLTEDEILYVFRTSELLSINDEYTYEKDGASYTGIIQNMNLEEGQNTLGKGATKIVFLDDIQPLSLSFNNSTTVTSIEGMKEHVDTSKVTDMGRMFDGCTNLTELDVSGFDTSKVTNMGSMFFNCKNLTKLDLSGFDTSNVTSMSGMFYNCTNLTELNVSGFETSKVTNMKNMFYGCYNLTKLDLSSFDTGNVPDMSYMFYNCTSLTELNVSGFDTSKVTNMGSMFYGCYSLAKLDLSDFDTSKVTDMKNMFYNCTNLTELDLSGFKTGNVTDMKDMFHNCYSLAKLDLSSFETSKVTDMKNMFYNCTNLTKLDLSGFDTSKVTDMKNMFYNCTNLTELNVSDFNTSNVTTMSYMFYNCTNLTELDVSGFETSKVTDMSYMFCYCRNLTKLDLSGFNTGNVTDMKNMFQDCRSLTELRFGAKTKLSSDVYLPTPSGTTSSGSTYTGKWTFSDPYNHTDALSAEELSAKAQEEGGATGTWVAEKEGESPSTQGYTSISTNLYDFASHLDDDGNVKDGEDPVSLFRTQVGDGYWQKLSDNRWAYTFFVYKNAEVSWRIWEDPVAGYTGDYTLTHMLDITGQEIQAGAQPTVTNTSTKAPTEYGSLVLTKEVIDETGAAYATDKSFSFTVTLTGDNISGAQVFGSTAFQNGVAKVQLQAGESITFSDIPTGTGYYITEDAAEGFTGSIDSPSGTISDTDGVTVTCTNTRKEEQKDYVSFSVKKEVISNADESDLSFSFHAVFTDLEISTGYTLSDGTTFTSDEDGNGNVDFTLTKDGTVTFQNIPVGAKYIITEDGGEYTSSYKITDTNGIGKILSSTGSSNQANAALSTLNETADKDEDVLITFTNTIVKTQNIVLTKLSLLADGSIDTGDVTQYLIDISLSGLKAGQKVKTTNGLITANDDGVIETSMYISPNQKFTLYSIPVGVTYRFSEQANYKIASYEIKDTISVVSASGANTVQKKALSTAEETVELGENATVTFTNTSPESAKLQVIKYDNSTDKNKLGGAEFALYKEDGTPVNFTADGTNIIKIKDNGSSDVLESALFVEGTYYLEETKAPDGYMASEPKSFTISASDLGKTLQIEVYDDKLIVLPITGGEGRNKYISIACILMAMSVSFLIYTKRTKKNAA